MCYRNDSFCFQIRCDECQKCFHFGCLDPPLKKSPKMRGYSWHCADCDPTVSDLIVVSRKLASFAASLPQKLFSYPKKLSEFPTTFQALLDVVTTNCLCFVNLHKFLFH